MVTAERENGIEEVLITFEDLDAQGQATGPLPSGYRGFTWSDSAWFMNRALCSSICPGSRAGLLNADAEDVTIRSSHRFDLTGLALCALWTDTAQVNVEGWENEVRKYSTTQTVSRGSTTRCTLDYRGIDRVELKADGTHLMITAITMLIP